MPDPTAATSPIATSETAHAVLDSPVGPIRVVGRDGAVVGCYLPEHRHAPDPALLGRRDDGAMAEATAQLASYFAGERTDFDLPLHLHGTAFQLRVWEELQRIPYGETISYGQLATRIGNPAASRAVGLANGRNPVSIIVPCHRVVGADGSLTGYGGGVACKQELLALEQARRGERLF